MNIFWRSHIGKLVAGGCGTQLGLMMVVGGLITILSFCAICAFTNILSLGLLQQFSTGQGQVAAINASTELVAPEQAPNSELDMLLAEIALLRSDVSAVGAGSGSSGGSGAAFVIHPTPTPGLPTALAEEGGVNMRSGPGINYTKLGLLPFGSSLEIVGRNPDSTWWLVSTRAGDFAWVSDMVVEVENIDDDIPIVTIPSLLVQPGTEGPASGGNGSALTPPTVVASGTPIAGGTPDPNATEEVILPSGPTPTSAATGVSRIFVEDVDGYKQLTRSLLLTPNSASFSPHEDQIAVTEGIKIYVITTDGSQNQIWLESDEEIGMFRDLTWSANGRYLAFTAEHKTLCTPDCDRVGIIDLEESTLTILEAPSGLVFVAPRWTQDGQVLMNAHPGEPASGTTYLYEPLSEQARPAVGNFNLVSSLEAQMWDPWLPGQAWQALSTERPDSYFSDSFVSETK